MGQYRQIDHTADIAVAVTGKDLKDLFRTASKAWRKLVTGNSKISNADRRVFHLQSATAEELLVDCLSELNYLLITKHWIFKDFKDLQIGQNSSGITLDAFIYGEPFIEGKHFVEVEIKAVTFHQMVIKKVQQRYETTIIFDI